MNKQRLLDACQREHQTTLKVLRAFPPGQADLRPHPSCRTAQELAWVFVLERGLATRVMQGTLNTSGQMPEPPGRFEDIITALEQAQAEYMKLLGSYNDQQMVENVTFFVGPKTPGPIPREQFAWFILHDEIHHRGQFSVYLRISGARVPSIYGPSADEPWF